MFVSLAGGSWQNGIYYHVLSMHLMVQNTSSVRLRLRTARTEAIVVNKAAHSEPLALFLGLAPVVQHSDPNGMVSVIISEVYIVMPTIDARDIHLALRE